MGDDCRSPSMILPATSLDSDFMNELLTDGCWVETAEGDEFTSLLLDSPLANLLDNLPDIEASNGCANSIPDKDTLVEEPEPTNFPRKRPLRYLQMEDPGGTQMQDWGEIQSNKRIWIGPKTDSSTIKSVRERLMSAIRYLFESTGDGNILIQIWVPVKDGNKHVLTTIGQPYSVDPNSLSLAQYRNVCENYQFPAEEDSKQSAGLPGRVFLRRVPEWTPDVRYFRQEEYPRIAYAQQLQVQGSLALPVFEQGSGSCLGVVEIVTTCQKINYRPELDTICKALEAFQLRSSEVTRLPSSKVLNDSYAAASPQISEFLAYTCKAHSFPLAQTWVPCTQHSSYADPNSTHCMSTVDDAYYVGDQKFLGFHEECCEQHLLGDKWIVGNAFRTNQLHFAPDITTYSKTDYPLAHHAILFGLCAAVAIRVHSIFTGSADFVLEFFLPVSCKSFEDQQKMIGSLLNSLQACQSLYTVTGSDLPEELTALPKTVPESEPFERSADNKETNTMGAKNKCKEIAVSSGSTKEEFSEEFKMFNSDDFDAESRHEPVFEDFGFSQAESKDAADKVGISSSYARNEASRSGKSDEKKRTKAEKHIDLHILQQYFAGSLKDASKSLGVCPTTLKRICRQHGIDRWPSRKIKKVGHSLKKLQLVMDSVQGADVQISSFYSKFPELGSPDVSGASLSVQKVKDSQTQRNDQLEDNSLNPLSQKRPKEILVQMNPQFEVGLISPTNKAPKSETLRPLPERPRPKMAPPLQNNSGSLIHDNAIFRLKVTFGELKVRFSLRHNWVFRDLQQEIATRFNFDDINKFHIMYMDDDSEWVLLTCDADLEECLEIHKATQSSLIELSVVEAPLTNLGTSFGSSGLS